MVWAIGMATQLRVDEAKTNLKQWPLNRFVIKYAHLSANANDPRESF